MHYPFNFEGAGAHIVERPGASRSDGERLSVSGPSLPLLHSWLPACALTPLRFDFILRGSNRRTVTSRRASRAKSRRRTRGPIRWMTRLSLNGEQTMELYVMALSPFCVKALLESLLIAVPPCPFLTVRLPTQHYHFVCRRFTSSLPLSQPMFLRAFPLPLLR
jgi:hypothetical protein